MTAKVVGVAGLLAVVALGVGCPKFSPRDPNAVDPNADPNSSGGTNLLTGTWKGTLNCSEIQQLSGSNSGPTTNTSVPNFSVTFDSNGQPTEILILGFVGVKDAPAQIATVGESQTLTIAPSSSSSTLAGTDVAQVSSALYTNNTATVVLSITHHATQGNLTQDGTAQQTVTISVSSDTMNYKNESVYNVNQVTGSITLQTGTDKTCTGSLTKQTPTSTTVINN